MGPLLFRGVIGITLGRRIYLSSKLFDRGEAEVARIIRHELAHVAQVRQLGLISFLYRYLEEYLGHRRDGHEIDEAYELISFEVEAREAEREDGL